MRIPILWVMLLTVVVIGGAWAFGVHKKDFLTPPSDSQLDAIRVKVVSTIAHQNAVPKSEPPPTLVIAPVEPIVIEEPKKEIDLGNLTDPLDLKLYAERATEGSAHLIELAMALEEKGHFNRALLAWERVIDLTRPDGEQSAAAFAAIRRIHPTLPSWNSDPTKAIAITLHAGTGKSMAKTLKPVIAEIATELSNASSGILSFSIKVAAGKTDLTANGPTPVALWLAGPSKDLRTTEVLSFTVDSEEELRQDILGTIFQLMRGYLNQTTTFTTPAALASDEPPLEALSYRFTRLCWQEFGTSLNLPLQKQPLKPKNP